MLELTLVNHSDIESKVILFRSRIIELNPLHLIFATLWQSTASKDVDLRATKVPPVIYVERPFMVISHSTYL